MARRSNTEMNTIENATKHLMTEEKLDGPQKLQDRLKEKCGIEISKQTALNLFDKYKTKSISIQNDTDISLEYENNPEIVKINERIKKLEKDFENATTASDRQKFNTALNDTQESKLKLKKILREAEMLKRTSDRKTVVVTFGTPEVIKIDNVKKPFFKTDEKQKSLSIVEKKDGEEL